MVAKVIVNRIRCKICDDVISSKYTHDFKSCQCGAIFVDGGTEYQRMGWGADRKGEKNLTIDDYIDTSLSVFDVYSEREFELQGVMEVIEEVIEGISKIKNGGDLYKAIFFEEKLKGHLSELVLLKKELKQESE
ncbi:hypothetical protein [Aneurinibacillus thermoaerophilus]|nr:hypothetical protein [Aneurinibacillus thermoaerophilus]MED0737110.1 hypothetical protein [Aneurinibacillus thermoaerophilus]